MQCSGGLFMPCCIILCFFCIISWRNNLLRFGWLEAAFKPPALPILPLIIRLYTCTYTFYRCGIACYVRLKLCCKRVFIVILHCYYNIKFWCSVAIDKHSIVCYTVNSDSAMLFHVKHFFIWICARESLAFQSRLRERVAESRCYSSTSIGTDFAYISCNSWILLPSVCDACVKSILTESVIE